jgi:cellulose synthase/poly-beta-1,6-N-acetylglucosamine synthase-like glycosyltransferase
MRATLAALLGQSHSRKEVIISVGHDDPETEQTAHRLAREFPDSVRVSVDHSETKNKPRQLNQALAMCRNSIVGVFDAESIAAPQLLAHIDSVFCAKNADVVQGAVQLINYRDTWYSLRNCLEYFTWFRSRLHAHSRQGFIPLGGNTVFIKRELLNEVAGWDADCLAEDCDLGVRLSTLGRKIIVAYAPELVTREETPDSISSLVRQRTRWSLGFMQVFAKGDWKSLPSRRMRVIAWWTLMQQHFMAFAGVCIPVAIGVAIWGQLPLVVTLVSFLPLIPTLATVAFDVCMLREFGQDHKFAIGWYDYFRLVAGTPFYQLILAFSALRALFKFLHRDFGWEKTDHSGAHLAYLEPAAPSAVRP